MLFTSGKLSSTIYDMSEKYTFNYISKNKIFNLNPNLKPKRTGGGGMARSNVKRLILSGSQHCKQKDIL